MVAMLDSYIFDIKDVESIKKHINLSYSRKERLGNNPYTQSVGAWSEKFDFEATLYYDWASVAIFEDMAKAKLPVWFVMLSGEGLLVTIDSIVINRSYFGFLGQPVKTEVTFVLEAYYE